MSKRRNFVLSFILTMTVLLSACAPAAALPTASAAVPQPTTAAPTNLVVQPTTAPASPAAVPTTAATLPEGSSMKVGLVTDTSGVNDHAFNQLAWAGMQKASGEMGFQGKFIESKQPSDYETNIDTLATESYNVIITVGSLMGDVTALKARQYPNIKFAIIDHDYTWYRHRLLLRWRSDQRHQPDVCGRPGGFPSGRPGGWHVHVGLRLLRLQFADT
jgi:basic membrane lipoprotein Med (substrate-binding protein (PBP1-ABC) superfamily)